MPPPDRIWRLASSRGPDPLIALVLSAFLLAYMAEQGVLRGRNNLLEAGCAVGVCGSVILRRDRPLLAAAVSACFLAASALGSSAVIPGSAILVPVFLVAYSAGTAADLRWSVPAVLAMGACLQLGTSAPVINPIIVVVTAGPYVAGLVVRSRRRLTEQLEVRGRELEAERTVFAAEAVRYERARIARELHDIVAHCVSVMVIQASAGYRLIAIDPSLAAEAFGSISEVAVRAEAEIGRLVELLGHAPPPRDTDGIQLIGELVARAGAAGLAVSCRFSGSADGLPAEAADAAYRVVQESLTNAFKHAPGAPVEILIAGAATGVEITVANLMPAGPPSGLERAGGGRGLAGMRERVQACGGEVSAGPADGGGWQVLARLPC